MIAFVTMVRDDREMLEKWIAHHETLTGDRKSLYVIAHGGEAEILAVAAGCSVISIPFDTTGIDFESKRTELMRRLADGLMGYFDSVCILDCDEFILVNPACNRTLTEILSQDLADKKVISPLGFEIVHNIETEKDDFRFEKPVFSQRRHGVFSSRYSKPCILRMAGLKGNVHNVKRVPWFITHDLLLVHLKWVDVKIVAMTAQKRAKAMETYDIDAENMATQGWDDKTGIDGWTAYDTKLAEYLQMFEQGVSDFPAGAELEWFPRRFERGLERQNRVVKMLFGPFKVPKTFESLL